MSRNFLTIQQAYAKLNAGTSSSNNFITKAQIAATGRADVSRLSGYSDHHFVVDDDIIEKAVGWPFRLNIAIYNMDRAYVYVESIYFEVWNSLRVRSTAPIRVYHIATGEYIDEVYVDVTFEPASYASNNNAKDLYVPWFDSVNFDAPWSNNVRIEVPTPSAFIFEPNSEDLGITEIIFNPVFQDAAILYP